MRNCDEVNVEKLRTTEKNQENNNKDVKIAESVQSHTPRIGSITATQTFHEC